MVSRSVLIPRTTARMPARARWNLKSLKWRSRPYYASRALSQWHINTLVCVLHPLCSSLRSVLLRFLTVDSFVSSKQRHKNINLVPNMVLSSLNTLAVTEIIFYTPAVAISFYLCFRHGCRPRMDGYSSSYPASSPSGISFYSCKHGGA
jgi:hypothetical protein